MAKKKKTTARTPRRSRKFWVGRNVCGFPGQESDKYVLFKTRPVTDKDDEHGCHHVESSNGNSVFEFCPGGWEKATGIKLKPGQVIRVEIAEV